MLCKHEAVGSIPSGSTKRLPNAAECAAISSKLQFRLLRLSAKACGFYDIVKRKYIRSPPLGTSAALKAISAERSPIDGTSERTSICGRSLTATLPGMFEAKVFFMTMSRKFLDLNLHLTLAPRTQAADIYARWTLIMRAIKCDKGIRRMPWR